MKIKLTLRDKDAGLLLRVLDEGTTLQSGHPRRQEQIDEALESLRWLNLAHPGFFIGNAGVGGKFLDFYQYFDKKRQYFTNKWPFQQINKFDKVINR